MIGHIGSPGAGTTVQIALPLGDRSTTRPLRALARLPEGPASRPVPHRPARHQEDDDCYVVRPPAAAGVGIGIAGSYG